MTSQCGGCGESVESRYLERHVRLELGYAAWRCGLCSTSFYAFEDAAAHFAGPFARHPGQPKLCQELLRYDLEPQVAQRMGLAYHAAHTPPPSPEDSKRFLAELKREPAATIGDLKQPPSAPVEAPQPPAPSPTAQASDTSADSGVGDKTLVDSPPAKPAIPFLVAKAEPSEAAGVEPKTETPTAGAVTCALCQASVRKASMRSHVLAAHSKSKPFACRLCPVRQTTGRAIRRHLKAEHGSAEAAFDDSSDSLAAVVDATLARCFGDTSGLRNPTKECRLCKVPVATASLLQHVSAKHLAEPVHQCRLCDFATKRWPVADALKHAAKLHKDQEPHDVILSHKERLAPIVKDLVAELF